MRPAISFTLPLSLLAVSTFGRLDAPSQKRDVTEYQQYAALAGGIRSAMLASIRTNWEQGVAAHAVLQLDNPEYSVFGATPFQNGSEVPVTALQLALSAVVRQSPDGRMSQEVGDGSDGASMDGAAIGSIVVLGTYTDTNRKEKWQQAANEQLNYLLNVAPRTSTGAISHRSDSRSYWADGVFVGFPFIAAYGAAKNNQTLLQTAYDQCRLYRDALKISGPTGPLWAHIYTDDRKAFNDKGIWATGNGWAALGMLHVKAAIMKSSSAELMQRQINDLGSWIKEILDGTFAALTPENLIPNYITGGAPFGDASGTAALASVAFRAAKMNPGVFGASYTTTAAKMAAAVLANVDNLGVVTPLVDPMRWNNPGILSTEGQAFSLMMLAAWGDWLGPGA